MTRTVKMPMTLCPVSKTHLLISAWVAILFSAPYVVYDITGVATSGGVSYVALSCSIVLILMLRVQLERPHNKEKLACVSKRAGAISLALFVAVETYAIMRGDDYLVDDIKILMNDILSCIEILAYAISCLMLSVFLDALKAEASSFKGESKASCMRMEAGPGSLGNIDGKTVSFIFGNLFASICLMIRFQLSYYPRFIQGISCIAIGVLLFFALCAGFSSNRWSLISFDIVPFLSGWVIVLISDRMACGEDLLRGFYSGVSQPAWYCVPAICMAIVLVTPCLKTRCGGSPEDLCVESAIYKLTGEGVENLSPREREVITRTLAGESISAIASDLSLSEGSVASYRARGYQKLSVGNLKGLKRRVNNGLISVENVSQPDSAEKRQVKSSLPYLLINAALSAGCALGTILLVFRSFCPDAPDELILSNGIAVYQLGTYLVWCTAFTFLVSGIVVKQDGDDVTRIESKRFASETLSCITSFQWLVLAFAFNMGVPLCLLDVHGFVFLLTIAVLMRSFVVYKSEMPLHYASSRSSTASPYSIGKALYSVAHSFRDYQTLFGAGLIMAVGTFLYAPPWMLPVFFDMVSITLGVRFLHKLRLREQRLLDNADSEMKMRFNYLRDNGFSDLHAHVTLDWAQGETIERTVEALATSRSTVMTYRRRACKILGVKSVDELRKLLDDIADMAK